MRNEKRNCLYTTMLRSLLTFLIPLSSFLILSCSNPIVARILDPKTASFETNGGSYVSSQTVYKAYPIKRPSTPSKSGYTFDAWYTDNETFLEEWDFNAIPNRDITLYANWNPDDPDDPIDTPVIFSGVTADGSSSQTTTQLTLSFSAAIAGLSAADIDLSGVTVTKGTLSGSNPYTLPISGITTGGTLSVAVAKAGYDISDSPKTATIYYLAPAYSISLSQTSTHTFPAATAGYTAQTPLTVSVNNTGNQATGALAAALSGTNADSFMLTGASISSIAVEGETTFTVAPNTGLAAGLYTATVTVSGGNGITAQTFDVSFTVNAPPSGTADIVSYYWVNEQDELAATTDSLSLSRGAEASLTITASGGGYSSQCWYVNGTEQSAANNQTAFIFSSAGKPNGNYIVGLMVEKDGGYYSVNIIVTVTE